MGNLRPVLKRKNYLFIVFSIILTILYLSLSAKFEPEGKHNPFSNKFSEFPLR